ncbi:NAD(P)-dependent oxidoreductase [Porphyromonadaceae bacterium W3.11]|nr:NAD(P)-dependent oxidoreductase [Porphyromonadaceae bacterium W3.11]
MATKVLIATEKPFAPIAVEKIRDIIEGNGFELVLCEKYTEKSQLLAAVADVDAMIVRSDKIDAEVIEAAKNLKIVVRAGAGYDNVDCEAATKHNVVVMNTPGQNANAVAELVFALLLHHKRAHLGGGSGSELMGKRFGVMSYGNIGENAARIAKGFGMDVRAFSRSTPSNHFWKDGYMFYNDRKTMFSEVDIMVIAMPSAANTKGMINYEMMNAMPKGGIIVNIARKDLVNEEDLKKVLADRPDLSYLTDVKPDCEAEIAEKFPKQYLATAKKMGAQTAEANINAGMAAASQIVGFIKDGNEKFRVNK